MIFDSNYAVGHKQSERIQVYVHLAQMNSWLLCCSFLIFWFSSVKSFEILFQGFRTKNSLPSQYSSCTTDRLRILNLNKLHCKSRKLSILACCDPDQSTDSVSEGPGSDDVENSDAAPFPAEVNSSTALQAYDSTQSLIGHRCIGVDYGLKRTGVCVSVGYAPYPLPVNGIKKTVFEGSEHETLKH